jgi:hypothetical protein
MAPAEGVETPDGAYRSGHFLLGEFHDQGEAKWRPAPGWPIARPGSGRPHGVFGVFSYY